MPPRKFAKHLLPCGVLAVGLISSAKLVPAKPEYTRKTKLECEYCHPPNERTLNDAGEYYRTHNYKMDGYKPKDPPGAKEKKPKTKAK